MLGTSANITHKNAVADYCLLKCTAVTTADFEHGVSLSPGRASRDFLFFRPSGDLPGGILLSPFGFLVLGSISSFQKTLLWERI